MLPGRAAACGWHASGSCQAIWMIRAEYQPIVTCTPYQSTSWLGRPGVLETRRLFSIPVFITLCTPPAHCFLFVVFFLGCFFNLSVIIHPTSQPCVGNERFAGSRIPFLDIIPLAHCADPVRIASHRIATAGLNGSQRKKENIDKAK